MIRASWGRFFGVSVALRDPLLQSPTSHSKPPLILINGGGRGVIRISEEKTALKDKKKKKT
jgi:hypothetical protein